MNYKIREDINIKSYLSSFYLSKSKIYKLFLEGKVLVNDKIVKDNYDLVNGDMLTIIDEKLDIKPYPYDLKILYEDDYILIIDKPYGYIIHGEEDAVDNMVAYYYKSHNLDLKVRHVHRLDKETTGILVYAKDILTEAYFNHHFELHDFTRYYLAKVAGKLTKDITIEKPIAKDRHQNNRYLISITGKYAKTFVHVLEHHKDYTLVLVRLFTGRTHQIRVHLKSINHPLLNDPLYNEGKGKMYLRSYKFTFIHPFTKIQLTIEAPI